MTCVEIDRRGRQVVAAVGQRAGKAERFRAWRKIDEAREGRTSDRAAIRVANNGDLDSFSLVAPTRTPKRISPCQPERR